MDVYGRLNYCITIALLRPVYNYNINASCPDANHSIMLVCQHQILIFMLRFYVVIYTQNLIQFSIMNI